MQQLTKTFYIVGGTGGQGADMGIGRLAWMLLVAALVRSHRASLMWTQLWFLLFPISTASHGQGWWILSGHHRDPNPTHGLGQGCALSLGLGPVHTGPKEGVGLLPGFSGDGLGAEVAAVASSRCCHRLWPHGDLLGLMWAGPKPRAVAAISSASGLSQAPNLVEQ